MAAISVNVPNADVPDALAALEQGWAGDAARLYFADRAAYDAANANQRAKACLAAFIAVSTRNYRQRELERTNIPIAVEPVIT